MPPKNYRRVQGNWCLWTNSRLNRSQIQAFSRSVHLRKNQVLASNKKFYVRISDAFRSRPITNEPGALQWWFCEWAWNPYPNAYFRHHWSPEWSRGPSNVRRSWNIWQTAHGEGLTVLCAAFGCESCDRHHRETKCVFMVKIKLVLKLKGFAHNTVPYLKPLNWSCHLSATGFSFSRRNQRCV